MREIKVEVRMNRDSSYTPDDDGTQRRWKIEIMDRNSNLPVATLSLTDAEWAAMHTGTGSGTVQAEILAPHMITNVGRIRWNAGILLDKDWDGNGYSKGDVRLANLLESGTIVSDCGALYGSAQNHRDGVGLSLVGYSATGEEAIRAALAAEHSLSVLVEAHGWKTRGKAHGYPSKTEHLERWA